MFFPPRIVVSDVSKDEMFVKLPFMSKQGNKLLSSDISTFFSKFHAQINLR